jgi:hypothetical protein
MKNSVIKKLKPFIPQFVLNQRTKYLDTKEFNEWHKNGNPIPSPHRVKQLAIAHHQQKYGYATLVETGTYMGDMVEAQRKRFKKIISIELGADLFKKAQKRFQNNKNVTILQGDSGKVLPQILKNLNEPAIFWLDGHYSAGITAKGDKDCPIFEEVDAIFNDKKFEHILLIDDARCFIGEGDYPTIDKLTEYIKNKNEKYKVDVENDIIRYVI